VAGCSEHGNEHSGFIKGREFLEQQSDCLLLKKDHASWSQERGSTDDPHTYNFKITYLITFAFIFKTSIIM